MRWLSLLLIPGLACAADLRLGIIGTDTSHATAFTKVLNDASAPNHVPGAKVVAAFKGGSPDIESSGKRVDGYAKELQEKYGVEIVPDIATLCQKVDAVLLESVDGRPHLAQAKQVIAAGKPLFIDKPLASTFADVQEIARLAKAANVPWFSSSSLRYSPLAQMKKPDMMGAITWGPGPLEPHHALSLSWYAIHPIETLFTLMGTGCEEVRMTRTEAMDEVNCRWRDGRLGTVRTLRPYGEYGAVVFTPKEIFQSPAKTSVDYTPLVREIVRFFQTRQPPVPNEETVEIFAFMDAAERSLAKGGAPVRLATK